MRIFDSRGAARAAVVFAFVACAVVLWMPAGFVSARGQQAAAAASLPATLADADFWALSAEISEPGGYFRITDNYTSNEIEVAQLMTTLRDRKLTGGVYLGVGPEQNFSYIAALRPAMAFIVDIRRQAVMQHLMFKAMFELSRDRADFLSLLFAKPRPKGLDRTAPIQQMWDAYLAVPTDSVAAVANHERVVQHLTRTRKFTLTPEEQIQLDSVIGAFVQFGPGITTRGSVGGRGGGNNLTFVDLTGWSYDSSGTPQSFLSTEEHFQTVKALHDKNLIVPVSGDFGGDKALRAIGKYLRGRGGTVTAFYVSNVEQYLFQDIKSQAFYDNVATLPLSDTSVFIRPYAVRQYGSGPALCGISAFLKQVQAGRVLSNRDAMGCGG